jgi:hypothetical protein
VRTTVPGALLIVKINVGPEVEAEFNRWYDGEHMPRLTAVPGVMSGRRYVNARGPHRYVAVYELRDRSVLKSQAWIDAANTAWTERMRRHFVEFGWDTLEAYCPGA